MPVSGFEHRSRRWLRCPTREDLRSRSSWIAQCNSPLFALGALVQVSGAPGLLWWALHLSCYAAGGWEPALAGLRALRVKSLDVDLLMIVAAVVAAAIGQVLDGALLIVIFAASGALEAVATKRTTDSVTALLVLSPQQATRLDPYGAETVVAPTLWWSGTGSWSARANGSAPTPT